MTASKPEFDSAIALVDSKDPSSEAALRGLCLAYPDDARFCFLLGALLERRGRYAEALVELDRALHLDPCNANAISAKALVLVSIGRSDEAKTCLLSALHRDGGDPRHWTNLGAVYETLGEPESALHSYDRALACGGAPAAARMNRGAVLSSLGRFPEALENNAALVKERPQDSSAHYNLADVLLALDRPEDCVAACATALSLTPDHARAMLLSGLGLSQLGRFDDAQRFFARARQTDPDACRAFLSAAATVGHEALSDELLDPEIVYLSRAHKRLDACDWSRYAQYVDEFIDIVSRRLASSQPLAEHALAYHALVLPVPEPLAFSVATALSSRIAKASRPIKLAKRSSGSGRLRIAYLSPDIREHVTAYLIRPLFAHQDRSQFEVFCYSTGPRDSSEIGTRVRASADEFRDMYARSSRKIVEQMLGDKIDILVDLGGYTAHARPDVVMDRPAPVQVGFLGYPGTLGNSALQYRISDRIATPRDQERFWSEKLVMLPDTFFIYDRPDDQAQPKLSRAEYGLPESGFVFCSFNNYYKLEPGIFGIWMQILEAVPGSVLWLAGRNPTAAENLRIQANRHGVSPDRLLFAPYESIDRYRARFALADLFLDTLVFNAMTTACDALAAGLPLLTAPGATFASRVATSLLTAARFTDGIANSVEAYRDRAIEWGRTPAILRALRHARLSNVLDTPLFDTRARVKQLEAAYLEMWRRHARGQPPESFEVSRAPSQPAARWY